MIEFFDYPWGSTKSLHTGNHSYKFGAAFNHIAEDYFIDEEHRSEDLLNGVFLNIYDDIAVVPGCLPGLV